MTLDIRGSLKNTRISKNPLVVVDELLANSIDAFLIRKRDAADVVALEVTLKVKATKADLLGEEYDLEITCEDRVGSPMASCQCSTGSWLVTIVEPRPWRSSRISSKSRRSDDVRTESPQSSRMSNSVRSRAFNILACRPSPRAIASASNSFGTR